MGLHMNYTFNLHQHVKIWLSNDPDIFLNLENGERLIKMRETNPDDEINLVYDSALLNEKALKDLAEFCNQYRVIPIDVRTQVLPHLKGHTEKKLFEFYHNEISNLGQGGNLGAASDILRWLESVWKLGHYTDFDVEINTTNLPKDIQAQAPVLTNTMIGPVYNCANTDIILIANTPDVSTKIKGVQSALLNALSRSSISPVQTRQTILDQTKDNQSFLRTLGIEIRDLDAFVTELIDDPSIPRTRQSDIEFLSKMRKQHRFNALKEHVINTSGPGAIRAELFKGLRDAEIMSHSIHNYSQIESAFRSLNQLSMTDDMIESALPGEKADHSWLDEGERAQKEREKTRRMALGPALETTYRFFREKRQLPPQAQLPNLLLNIGNPETLRQTLSAITGKDRLPTINQSNEDDQTILQQAAQAGLVEVVAIVLDSLPKQDRLMALTPDPNQPQETIVHMIHNAAYDKTRIYEAICSRLSEEDCLELFNILEPEDTLRESIAARILNTESSATTDPLLENERDIYGALIHSVAPSEKSSEAWKNIIVDKLVQRASTTHDMLIVQRLLMVCESWEKDPSYHQSYKRIIETIAQNLFTNLLSWPIATWPTKEVLEKTVRKLEDFLSSSLEEEVETQVKALKKELKTVIAACVASNNYAEYTTVANYWMVQRDQYIFLEALSGGSRRYCMSPDERVVSQVITEFWRHQGKQFNPQQLYEALFDSTWDESAKLDALLNMLKFDLQSNSQDKAAAIMTVLESVDASSWATVSLRRDWSDTPKESLMKLCVYLTTMIENQFVSFSHTQVSDLLNLIQDSKVEFHSLEDRLQLTVRLLQSVSDLNQLDKACLSSIFKHAKDISRILSASIVHDLGQLETRFELHGNEPGAATFGC